jgi:hypothetical protein
VVQLPPFTNTAPVKGRQPQGKSKEPLAEHEYDALLLAALHHLAAPSRTHFPVLLSRDRRERFDRRTKKSIALLVVGRSRSYETS